MTKKNNNTAKSTKFITIFTMIICLVMCISFAELFSSLITVGGFNTIKDNEIKQPNFSLYAISMYSTETKIQAKEMSEMTKRKSGAGYIWQSDKCYYVFASCYQNEADAIKVSENLQENNVNCQIVKLDFDSIIVSAKTNEQEKTTLQESVLCYKNLFKKLYDLSVSIDTNLYTEIEVKIYLSDIISEFTKTKTSFETLFNSKLTSDLLELKLSLTNIANILESLSEFSSLEIPYTSQVKNTYFQVLNEYNNISKSL